MQYLLILFVLLISSPLFCQVQTDKNEFYIYVQYGRYSTELVKQMESNSNYRYYKFFGDYYIDRYQKDVIEEKFIKEGLNALYPDIKSKDFVAIDIENIIYQNVKDYDKGNSNFEEGIAELIRLISIFKKERPNLKVGIYGIPFTFYDENQKVQNKDQKLDPLLKKIDYILPSLYILYPDKETGFDKNKAYLEGNLKVALEYGKRLSKPVIPFVWYLVHPSNKKYGTELISCEEMLSYLKIIRDYQFEGQKAKGVIWWEPAKTDYKLSKEMQDMNAKYLSKDEILEKYILSGFFLILGQNLFCQNIRSVKDWEILFLNNWDKEYVQANILSQSNDSWQYYYLAYSIDANSAMFQATGNTKYLDRALYYINNVINSAVISSKLPNSQYKDTFYGWASYSNPSLEANGKEYPLYESFCWRYVTHLLYIIYSSPSLLSNDIYKKQYNNILKFTEINIYNKWTSRGIHNIYRINKHMTSHWVNIAMDLYGITKNEKYKAIVDYFAMNFKNQSENNPTVPKAIFWKANWDNTGDIQDVSHGNAVVGTIIEMYERGWSFTTSDINALIITFDKVIWSSDSIFANQFDGSGNGKGWFSDGLIKLGRFDKSLQLRIEKHKSRDTQFYGNGALNAYYLMNNNPTYQKD